MIEIKPDELKRAVETQHGCTATLVQSVPVRERHGDATVWEGIVHVFDLTGHPEGDESLRMVIPDRWKQ